MKLADLDYELPANRIAQRPAAERDAARLMRLRRAAGTIEDRVIRDLPRLLRPGDCCVLNRTRVVPARLEARRQTGGRVEGLFVREIQEGDWEILLSGAGRLRVGETLTLERRPKSLLPIAGAGEWAMELRERRERGAWRAAVQPAAPAERILAAVGRMPLPPYIRREPAGGDGWDAMDRERYQTVFAASVGAVAAPTAGLHFTQRLLAELRGAGVSVAEVTLHVGLGTFAPVEVDDLNDHRMHAEWFDLPAATVEQVQAARQAGGRIVAVGTTSVRVLESRADEDGRLAAGSGWTCLLIQPPYRFRVVDALLTNFHLPRSTLLALVCAFAGRDCVMQAYRAAIERGYRFYSYGDAMLIE